MGSARRANTRQSRGWLRGKQSAGRPGRTRRAGPSPCTRADRAFLSPSAVGGSALPERSLALAEEPTQNAQRVLLWLVLVGYWQSSRSCFPWFLALWDLIVKENQDDECCRYARQKILKSSGEHS